MKYLEWDTKFFNKKSYNMYFSKANFIPNKYKTDFFNYFSNTFIAIKINTKYDYSYFDFLQKNQFKYIDTDVSLKFKDKAIIKSDTNVKICKLDSNIDLPYEKLGSVFSLTRFHTDPNIENEKADLLWIEYLRNFIPTENKHIYIAKIGNEIVGVILINVSKKEANIFYVSVISKYKNSGIGTEMMNRVIDDFKNFNITTGTQIKNIQALNFYIKNGFMIKNTSNIFHRWS